MTTGTVGTHTPIYLNPIGGIMVDSAACVIAQQCSSTTFISILLSRKAKFGIPIALSLKLRNLKLRTSCSGVNFTNDSMKPKLHLQGRFQQIMFC